MYQTETELKAIRAKILAEAEQEVFARYSPDRIRRFQLFRNISKVFAVSLAVYFSSIVYFYINKAFDALFVFSWVIIAIAVVFFWYYYTEKPLQIEINDLYGEKFSRHTANRHTDASQGD